MSENSCAVYVHVNLINGKKYFGITTQNPPENRWRNGSGYKNTHFRSAIKKYGWDNFAHYVLYRDIPIKIARNIEEMLIKEHMSYDPHFGYNKTMGGELERHTREGRQKISDAKKEYFNNHPEERVKISEFMKSEKNPMKNPEIAKKCRKDVLCIETGIIYHGVLEADRMTGINFKNISSTCHGRRKTAGGFHWRYIDEGVDNDGNY